jgi:dimethylamine/trimethylamine dehydrogenase
MRDPRFDILFEPVQIGPHTTRNRFYQVPHCTGMGYRHPNAEAAHRGVKAEGGWGVVSTQETEIHPTSDLSPANEARLWSDADIPALRLMTDAVHEHGSLAAVQLVHGGSHSPNLYSRETAIAPSPTPIDWGGPLQAREIDLWDIRALRGWYVAAAKRAKAAQFDIVYAYAGHDMTILQHFLLSRHNHRTDEYGGSFENRLRLFREVVADLKDAVGDTCAIAIRLAVDELMGSDGIEHENEGRDIIEALAEEPDLWDVNLSDWSNDSQTSRFAKEGFQEPYTAFVKSVTTKPVVGVGRYTSPDTMVRLIKSGHLDLIGAARPSIADPHLPRKIEEGRINDIRECIGCNICTAGDNTNVPMRCTQNPTVGEEWRRGWHPERIKPLKSADQHLIIGGGPAGLEAARALTQRGADVTLSEARETLGGRVTLESKLPSLAEWARVRDWRIGQLNDKPNAQLFTQSPLTAEDILAYGIPNIALATGSTWRSDGVGRTHKRPLSYLDAPNVFGPDTLMANGPDQLPKGPIAIFDDETFYLGSVLAERVANTGREVLFITPSAIVAPYSENTLEQSRIQRRLIELGVKILPLTKLANLTADALTIACLYSEKQTTHACAALIPVTMRLPNDQLWHDLQARKSDWRDAGLKTVTRIGDCYVPGLIALATQAGYRYGVEFGEAEQEPKREVFVGGSFKP